MEILAEADKLEVACMRGQKGLGFGFVESGGGWKCQKVQKMGLRTLFALNLPACTGTCKW